VSSVTTAFCQTRYLAPLSAILPPTLESSEHGSWKSILSAGGWQRRLGTHCRRVGAGGSFGRRTMTAGQPGRGYWSTLGRSFIFNGRTRIEGHIRVRRHCLDKKFRAHARNLGIKSTDAGENRYQYSSALLTFKRTKSITCCQYSMLRSIRLHPQPCILRLHDVYISYSIA
jgi:hypothetical protein